MEAGVGTISVLLAPDDRLLVAVVELAVAAVVVACVLLRGVMRTELAGVPLWDVTCTSTRVGVEAGITWSLELETPLLSVSMCTVVVPPAPTCVST
jgi:hypothetical protein